MNGKICINRGLNFAIERHLSIEEKTLSAKIEHAQALAIHGNLEGARALYKTLWEDAMRDEDHYQACVAAHFLAHTYAVPECQLTWHLRALHAANAVGDEHVHTFYPSLYANLSEVYLRLGDHTKAREYIDKARQTTHVLLDDGYGRMIQSLINRLTQTLESHINGTRA